MYSNLEIPFLESFEVKCVISKEGSQELILFFQNIFFLYNLNKQIG